MRSKIVETYGVIYKAEFPNGKLYVGATTDLDGRIKDHRRSVNSKKRGCVLFKRAA